MPKRFLEAGEIINTHGVRGEVKIRPWADSPGFLARLKLLYIDGAPVRVKSARVHKGCVVALLDGVDSIAEAETLKGRTVFIDREDAPLEEGRHFIADMIGMRAQNAETGEPLGVVSDILSLPAGEVYVIDGEREMLIPAVREFVEEIDIAEGVIKFRVIEGL